MEELEIENSELIGQRSLVRGKLNGARYSLEDKIAGYSKKFSPPRELYEKIESFFIINETIYERFRGRFGNGALVLGAHLGSLYGSQVLDGSTDETLEKYFENRKINFSKPYPTPINEMIELYIGAMSVRSSLSLESLSASFFSWCQKSTSQLINNYYQEMENTFRGKEVKIQDHIFTLNFSGKKNGVRRANTQLRENLLRQSEETKEKNGGKKAHQYLAGHDEVIKEFQELNFRITHKEEFAKYLPFRRVLYNILLAGPSGTGKTTLVRSVAEAEGIYFSHVPGAQLFSSFYTETAANVDAVYETTIQIVKEKKLAGAYIFFDEIDALARKRGSTNSSEDDKNVTTLCERLDGGATKEGIITVGATNKLESISESIRSRFKTLQVGYPQTDEEVIAIHEAIRSKINDYAGQELIPELDYMPVLPFSQQNDLYKSGRIIERLMYQAVLEKVTRGVRDGQGIIPVNTTDLVRAYQDNPLARIEPVKSNQVLRLRG